MNVLIVGRGGREHAIIHKLSESPLLHNLFVAPGNDGMENIAQRIAIEEDDIEGMLVFARQAQIDLTIIGPESPLIHGMADAFMKEGLLVFGPSKMAATLEGSKDFSKKFMQKHGIPTAQYASFTDYEEAKNYILQQDVPIVIKADGLASGKGVTVAMTHEEAMETLRVMMKEKKFGEASSKVVIEEFLIGEEYSFMALVNGEVFIPLQIAQDHKRAFDGDTGPNTGGMGAYSPVPHISEEMVQMALHQIIKPTVSALFKENCHFCGVLYSGIIQTATGPKVIEYNVRFGDPETQVVLPRMKTDLLSVLVHLLNGVTTEIIWDDDTMVGVVLASKGYPEEYSTGSILNGLEEIEPPTYMYHAGSKRVGKNFVSAGGRILLVGRKGKSIEEARDLLYKELNKIKCEDVFYRRDIGSRGLKKQLNA